jgi:hypothetical protein
MAKTKVYREYAENYQEFQEPITDAEVADLFLSPRIGDFDYTGQDTDAMYPREVFGNLDREF